MFDEPASLWNLTKHKHRLVRRYIRDVYPNLLWGLAAKQHFLKVKEQALNAITANESLNIIGYRYRRLPTLISFCWKIDNQEAKT